MKRILCLIAGALLAPGCSCGPQPAALAIKVDFDSTSLSQCAVVSISSAKATQKTKALKRPTDNQLIVGVEPTPELSGMVTPSVKGFAAADCSGTAIEEAAAGALNLDKPGRQEVTLTLRGKPNGDGGPGGGAGGGGGSAAGGGAAGGGAGGGTGGGGGGDAGCIPTAEVCTDGLDNDCDGFVDCRDPSCLGLGCNDGDLCTNPDQCQSDGGCGGAPVTCTMPGTCEVSPGKCAAGVCGYDAGVGLVCNGTGVCRSDKTCADAGSEVFCANAIDDDGDLATDCGDTDCNGQACDAGPSTCFLATACQANACAKLTPVTCTPPSPCFVSSGACVEGTGCPFTLLDAGTACPGGACRADGGCTPLEVCSNGSDDDLDGLTDCADPDCNLLACDDGNACTGGTTCQLGVCDGGSVCPAPSSCATGGTCGSDGGCQFQIAVFSKCDGGFCRPNGTCGSPFPYVPSNFDPNALTVPDASVAINCLAEYDSTFGAANNGFVSWCGPLPSVFTLSQQDAGGEDIDVMVVPNLIVTDGGSIYLTGQRPVVLAVFGNATVDGRIVAGPRPGSNARGAGGSLQSLLAKAHCVVGGSTGRGADGVSGNQTSGGGGGGAFGLAGGNGGNGGALPNSGGAGGLANGNLTLIPLRGGCPGGLGGNNYLGGPAAGGYGGGALQMSVGGALNLSGFLGAPGIAGEGANNSNDLNAGGGGAGSGGGILIEAATLRLFMTAAITAHGGGGGEGDGDPGGGGQAGNRGEDGHVTNGLVAAGGVGGSGASGNGGHGGVQGIAASNGDAGAPGGNNAGGGGGGASVGRIRINVVGQCRVDAGSLISPAYTGTCQ